MVPLKRSDFDYLLPDSNIRQERLIDTNKNKLLLRTSSGEIQHHLIENLAQLLPERSLIIINNTRVLPSRLFGSLPTGGKAELFLLEMSHSPTTHSTHWRAFGRPMRKLQVGCRIELAGGLTATIGNIDPFNQVDIEFHCTIDQFDIWLDQWGHIPLPPYIKRPNSEPSSKSRDRDLYQTTFAKEKGSVAAPTAGLHLNQALMKALSDKGIEFAPITLHVGAGTFLPVKSENLEDHTMHSERYQIPLNTYEKILEYQRENLPIILVGTTSLRCVEDFFLNQFNNSHTNCWHRTNIFIHPKSASDRYSVKVGNALLTNFHQPYSSLLMLVSALIGLEEIRTTYDQALEHGYQFLSYGDASLLWFPTLD